jgi:hypothetical protein
MAGEAVLRQRSRYEGSACVRKARLTAVAPASTRKPTRATAALAAMLVMQLTARPVRTGHVQAVPAVRAASMVRASSSVSLGKLIVVVDASTPPPTITTAAPAAMPATEGRLARAGRAPGSFAQTLPTPQASAPLVSGAAVPGYLRPAITRRLMSAAHPVSVVSTAAPPARSAILVLRFAATASALPLGPPAHSQPSELPGKEVVATIRLRGPGVDGYGPLNLTWPERRPKIVFPLLIARLLLAFVLFVAAVTKLGDRKGLLATL